MNPLPLATAAGSNEGSELGVKARFCTFHRVKFLLVATHNRWGGELGPVEAIITQSFFLARAKLGSTKPPVSRGALAVVKVSPSALVA